jgi:hypothetical protein
VSGLALLAGVALLSVSGAVLFVELGVEPLLVVEGELRVLSPAKLRIME